MSGVPPGFVPGAAGVAAEAVGFAAAAGVSAGLGELLHEPSTSAVAPATAVSVNFFIEVEVTSKDAPERIMR